MILITSYFKLCETFVKLLSRKYKIIIFLYEKKIFNDLNFFLRLDCLWMNNLLTF